MTERWMIGVMSGTSADGMDAALVQITGSGIEMHPRLVRHLVYSYPAELRERIFAVGASGAATLAQLGALARDISLAYVAAVKSLLEATDERPEEIAAIAAHGQTLYHAPPITIQSFDPAVLASGIGCAVVSDFRRADCAAGGQGAPLVPFADYLLFRDPHASRVLLNLGGIANLTLLPAGASMDRIIAFDTGPANCISDHLVRQQDPSGIGYDASGTIASRGSVIEPLASAVLASDFFKQAPPKSTDGPRMIEQFDASRARLGLARAALPDLLATSCAIAARAILRAIEERLPGQPVQLIISGGGTRNETLMSWLRRSRHAVTTTDNFGVPSAAKEAIAFALLAAATLDGIPSNLPSVTGARRPVVLGSITPAP